MNNQNQTFDVAAINSLFNITAPKEAAKPDTLADIREAFTAELEAETAPTWAGLNEAFASRNWAITPSKSLFVAYFGKERGGKAWEDCEARWSLLQTTAAIFVADWGLESLPVSERSKRYKERKTALFKQVRSLLSYHSIDLGRDLKASDLLALGDLAIKYAYMTSTGEVGARALGTAAYIKAALHMLLGRDNTAEVISALSEKAMKRVEKARDNADKHSDWNATDHPRFLLG